MITNAVRTSRFRDVVGRVVPDDAVVIVVTRGDSSLLDLGGPTGWHFPQRSDGVYAGYYPEDSRAAVAHLEALRKRGGEFLALPAAALWWLDHYPGLAEHLDERYELVVRNESVGAVYALVENRALDLDESALAFDDEEESTDDDREGQELGLPDDLADDVLEGARTLFDAPFYAEQADARFDSEDAALAHYLLEGSENGLSPSPLVDEGWYHERYPAARATGQSALVHFLANGARERQDPNPYFDTAYYAGQHESLDAGGVNPLVHYVLNSPSGNGGRTNPLFHDSYYRQTYPDVGESGMPPLEHFLRFGASEGRFASHHHRNLFDRLRSSSVKSMLRGNWKQGTAIVFVHGTAEGARTDLASLTEDLAEDHRLDVVVIQYRRSPDAEIEGHAKVVVLQDYEMACDIFRPSALRMLARTMWRLKPVLAVSEVPEVLAPLRDGGMPVFYVGPTPNAAAKKADPDQALAASLSVKLPRVRGKHAVAMLERAVLEFGVDPELTAPRRTKRRHKLSKVVVVCSDWTVSGVNAAMHAIGTQLRVRGWDVEILFTRDEEYVLESAGGHQHMPQVPHRFLERSRSGLDGMWEALITDLQRNGPCIAFLTYDHVGNCVVPALTDEIGVVAWMQADDGDYYEQAYRLGRYCNGIVCVSSHIRDTLAEINPALAPRTRVIHNTSVGLDDVASRRRRMPTRLPLVYTGRLVQYQKRVLDYVELAKALDRAGVDYEISLIGEFAAKEGIQPVFEDRAKEHLADGRIRLPGRMSRAQILQELRRNAFFLLLSDFEGLPLSLVEAMACGCVPIVAEMPSGIPELVTAGKDGFIINGRDYDAWAAMLAELWADRDQLKAMSRAARTAVRERFTIEKIGGEFDAMMREIADEIDSGQYVRPPALTWGPDRSQAGDVLPSPNLFLPNNFSRYPGLT